MDKPKSPPSPHATTSTAANSRSLQNLKSLLLKCAIASTTAKKSLTGHQEAFIENHIEQILPNIHTPDHPTYAWMIENAIRQLNEDCGSSEESISKFICEEYKDLPFANASLLRHHLKKLSESDDIVLRRNGCYSIAKSSDLHSPTSNPNPTTSLVPVFSSNTGYDESNSTYSSSECFVPNRKTKRKKIKRKRSQNARGIQIRTKHGRGRGRGRGRGLGSDENTMMELIVDHQYITINDDVADENVQGNRIQDSVDVDNGSTPSTRRRKKGFVSGLGSKNVGPCQRSVRSIRTPQRGKRRGRPRKQDMQMVEYGNNMEMANVEERDDDMDILDELIEEVYMELKGERERECLQIRDGHAEVMEREINLQRKDDEISEAFGLEPLERERCVDDNLGEEVGNGTHVVNENQFQPQPEQTKLALVPYEPQRQESNEIELQIQLKGVEMETVEPTATTTIRHEPLEEDLILIK